MTRSLWASLADHIAAASVGENTLNRLTMQVHLLCDGDAHHF